MPFLIPELYEARKGNVGVGGREEAMAGVNGSSMWWVLMAPSWCMQSFNTHSTFRQIVSTLPSSQDICKIVLSLLSLKGNEIHQSQLSGRHNAKGGVKGKDSCAAWVRWTLRIDLQTEWCRLEPLAGLQQSQPQRVYQLGKMVQFSFPFQGSIWKNWGCQVSHPLCPWSHPRVELPYCMGRTIFPTYGLYEPRRHGSVLMHLVWCYHAKTRSWPSQHSNSTSLLSDWLSSPSTFWFKYVYSPALKSSTRISGQGLDLLQS